jgi:xylulokinase
MAENGTGGNTLEHFLERLVYTGDAFGQLSATDRFELLQRAVGEAPAGSGGVLFLPWLGGSMAPAADDRMRGGFLNIGLATRRCELARAVLEGVAMNLHWLRGPVERFAKRQFSHFVFYGGAAASDAWAQILADVLDAPVHQARDPQYVACRGAALLAFQRLGLLGFDEFASRLPIARRFDPNPAHRSLYDHLSARFVEAFQRTRPVFHALNRPEATA